MWLLVIIIPFKNPCPESKLGQFHLRASLFIVANKSPLNVSTLARPTHTAQIAEKARKFNNNRKPNVTIVILRRERERERDGCQKID